METETNELLPKRRQNHVARAERWRAVSIALAVLLACACALCGWLWGQRADTISPSGPVEIEVGK